MTEPVIVGVDEAQSLPYVDLGEVARRALAEATPDVRRALVAGACDLMLHVDMSRVPALTRLDDLIRTNGDVAARAKAALDEWARAFRFRPLRRLGIVPDLNAALRKWEPQMWVMTATGLVLGTVGLVLLG